MSSYECKFQPYKSQSAISENDSCVVCNIVGSVQCLGTVSINCKHNLYIYTLYTTDNRE